MTQFGGSFRFVQLPAVTQLLADLRSTGRLSISQSGWSGEIVVREGQIVAARLGAEHGRAALEAIAVALPEGEFSFTDEPVDATSEALIAAADCAAYLDRLSAEHQRVAPLIPSLGLVPRLVDASDGTSPDTQVTIAAAALLLIPALVHGHTLEQLARERGLVRTLREAADLLAGGLIRLEPKPSVAAEPVVEKPIVTEKPVRVQPISTQPTTTARPLPPRLAFARHAAPTSSSAQPPAAIPPGVAARLSTARRFALQPAPPQRVHLGALRKAIVSFFLTDN